MAISFDACTENDGGGATSLSFSHTLGSGSEPIILVATYTRAGNSADLVVSSITYGGVALTKYLQFESAAAFRGVSIWYLRGGTMPAPGARTVAVTGAAGVFLLRATAITLFGVGGAPEASGTFDTTVGGTSSTVTFSTLTANAWIVDQAGLSATGAPTAAGGQTSRANNFASFCSDSMSTKATTTAGSYSMTWNASVGTFSDGAHLAVSVPASGGAASDNALFHSAF